GSATQGRGGVGRLVGVGGGGDDGDLRVHLGEADQRGLLQVEHRPVGQGVHDGPGHHEGGVAPGLVGVGDRRAGVDDVDGAGADDGDDPLVVDLRGRVLVNAHAQQAGGGGHQGEQPGVAGALVEVLVDDDA